MATSVTASRVRVEFLTDRFIRLQWSEDGVFEDRPSMTVCNRDMPSVAISKRQAGRKLTITSDALTLQYDGGGDAFSADNLSIRFEHKGKKLRWCPGTVADANLGGTSRTLDGVDGDRTFTRIKNPLFRKDAPYDEGKRTIKIQVQLDLGQGLLSRDGWVLIDDTETPLFENGWAVARSDTNRQDWYFLAYGTDYKVALRDAASVFGSQPLPPRYVFGYWWSHYWAYTDREIEQLVASCDAMQIPIDVMVLDMDWHRKGWTGYSWDKDHFPDPDAFLADLKAMGVKTTLNLHPAEGVGKHEQQFKDMAMAMGLDPKRIDHIPFAVTNPTYIKHYFEMLHHPEERRGVDFWWMDWQQGKKTAIKGLDPLPWLNHLHWQDMAQNPERGNKRPLIFSRYGGLGAGRYCIGFSGDTFSSWASLAYQTYFTATASNVLYGYWSHDIGGHQPGPVEPELYLRWVQYGAYSPVLRTHTCKNADAERRFWEYPVPYSQMMAAAIRDRYEMVPYIYSECRKAYDSGISLCRPMYYDWPDAAEAYDYKHQYMFGDHMLVSPVVEKADAVTQLATVDTWLPDGDWFNIALGITEKGGRVVSHAYMLDEVPCFVRAGTILPGQRSVKRLNDASIKDLRLTIYPGKSGQYTLYEDDGLTTGYQDKGFVQLRVSHKRARDVLTIHIEPPVGRYKGYRAKKNLEIRLPGTVPPISVDELEYAFRLGEKGWTYDGDTGMTIVRVPGVQLPKGFCLRLKYSTSKQAEGLKGAINRFSYVRRMLAPVSGHRLCVDLCQLGNRVSRQPQSSSFEITRMRKELIRTKSIIQNLMTDCGDKSLKSTRYAAFACALTHLAVAEAYLDGWRGKSSTVARMVN